MALLRRRGLGLSERRLVVANIDGGEAIRGVLTGVYQDVIVLEHASHIGQAVTEMVGVVRIPRGRVRWLQEPGDAAVVAAGESA